MKALKICCDGKMEAVEIERPTYKGLSKAIGARNFEIVHAQGLADGLVLVVDEEGRIAGRKINQIACWLYGHTIVGDVLIMQEGRNVDGEPDILGLGDVIIDTISDQLFVATGGFAHN